MHGDYIKGEMIISNAVYRPKIALNWRWLKNLLKPRKHPRSSSFIQIVRSSTKNEEKEMWTLYHGYFAIMGGFELKAKEGLFHHNETYTITQWGLLRLAEWNMLPDIRKRWIYGRSKSDEVGKTLVMLQVSWMMIQTLARKIAKLPITLLEINTVAHVLCAIALYLLWWHKPQDVMDTIIIDLSLCEKCNQKLKDENFGSKGLAKELENSLNDNIRCLEAEISTKILCVCLSALSLIYGAIHATAWDAHFPSLQEQILWRVAACVAGGVGSILWLLSIALEGENTWTINILWIITAAIYSLARLFLITEAFISIRSLPAGAYDTVSWVNFLPHIG